jgi:hypothetical protein
MTKINDDIKYCVTSMTDLLGFSSHLEIGNDLRTKIGQEAISRLQFIEDTISKFTDENQKHSEYYPKHLKYQRINDSLILTLDLPDLLTPTIGEIVKNGISAKEISEHFTEEELTTEETFLQAYKNKLTHSILELSQFIGLVSRIHAYLNRKETENYFPGAKTVISSGYRKSFMTKVKQEDYFSANFSFSNAYLAEQQLKGARLFIDNYILQITAVPRLIE